MRKTSQFNMNDKCIEGKPGPKKGIRLREIIQRYTYTLNRCTRLESFTCHGSHGLRVAVVCSVCRVLFVPVVSSCNDRGLQPNLIWHALGVRELQWNNSCLTYPILTHT